MAVNESAENYLETILVLSKTHPVVRSVDIAEELGFKKSSVSVAMKNLPHGACHQPGKLRRNQKTRSGKPR